jgi:hypothetical protein
MKWGQAVVTLSQVSVTLKQLKKEDQEGTTTTTWGSVNFKNIEGTVEVTEVVDAEWKKSKKTTAKVWTTWYTPTSIDF